MFLNLTLLLMFTLRLHCFVGKIHNGDESYDDLAIEQVIKALTNITHYFAQNYEEVNLDAIFGVRSTEGTLHHMLTIHKDILQDAPGDTFNTIQSLYNTVRKITRLAYKKLLKDNSDYSRLFRPIISSRWFYERPERPPDKPTSHVEELTQNLNEDFSDKCMTELMGTAKNATKCTISNACWKLMNSDGNDGYTLTHQILFFLLSDVIGCKYKLASKLRPNNTAFDERLTTFGSDVYHQLSQISSDGSPHFQRDLFLEQCVVCSWLGIQHCIDQKQIAEVLKWQDESGCYKDGNLKNNKISVSSRKLLAEKELEDGCQSHTSGLLIAYLAASLHWMVVDRHQSHQKQRNILKYFLGSTDKLMVSGYANYRRVLVFVIVVLIIFVIAYLKRKRAGKS